MLQALSGASQEAVSAANRAAEAQERLHKSPWCLLQEADVLNPDRLCPAARAAQLRCRQLSKQLGSASNERMLRALLPGSAVHAFVAADSSAGVVKEQQMAALMQARPFPPPTMGHSAATCGKHPHRDMEQWVKGMMPSTSAHPHMWRQLRCLCNQ